ncbi:unnamed protein product [Anisakis simplex]|uniref:G_PROTEIN_RECEP_F1_2 domain-containing protein n=1 Tax=Anisakis simplex TaxID=6269 RepID=A0A0M3K8P2_ANISI|nr:unnamed protein product [Anisakis simplex]
MNMVTILVLTRPTMISPVNVLLCSVAICDVVVMTSYLVFIWHFLIEAADRCEQRDYSYAWAAFTLFHAHASVIFHSTSIWLTVSFVSRFFDSSTRISSRFFFSSSTINDKSGSPGWMQLICMITP